MNPQNQNLERVLESAVVASWRDLMRGAQTGQVQIEYDFSPSGKLDYLQVWSSIRRGSSFLVCSWRAASRVHDNEVHFDNGYQSTDFQRALTVVMQHQNAFTLPPNLGRKGCLYITTPTEIESVAAAASVKDALNVADALPADGPPQRSRMTAL